MLPKKQKKNKKKTKKIRAPSKNCQSKKSDNQSNYTINHRVDFPVPGLEADLSENSMDVTKELRACLALQNEIASKCSLSVSSILSTEL